jgi:hypothetical protein
MVPVEAEFRGGINIPRPRRLLWQRRFKATRPLGRLTITPEELSIWAIPGSNHWAYPTATMARSRVKVSRVSKLFRHGLAFVDETGVSYFWRLRTKRIVTILESLDYVVNDGS